MPTNFCRWRHQPKLAELHWRDERRPQQPRARQRGQPLRIGHIGLATGYGLDVPRVDHPGDDAHRLQRRKRALPIQPRALHDDNLGPDLQRPLCQGAAVAIEGTEVALGNLHSAVIMFETAQAVILAW